MEIYYKKNNNNILFEKLNTFVDVTNLQNYIPLYNNYFQLNNNNYNSINLYNKYYLNNINNKVSYNKFNGSLIDNSNGEIFREIFFKYSPIIDPVKYLIGKYNNISENYSDNSNIEQLYKSLYILPSLDVSNCLGKYNDVNNSSYVDSFFSFLSSKLLNNYNFINGLDFYGTFLCIKDDFLYNIEDDIDILSESEFFLQNKDLIYKIDNKVNELFNYDTRNNKSLIKLNNIDNVDNVELEYDVLSDDDNYNTTDNECSNINEIVDIYKDISKIPQTENKRPIVKKIKKLKIKGVLSSEEDA